MIFPSTASQPLLQLRVIGVLLLKFCLQDLDLLQLTIFLPIPNQQDSGTAVGGLALEDFGQLFLGGFQLIEVMQGNGQVIAVADVIGTQFNRLGKRQQGKLALVMYKQPSPKRMLQA